MRTSTDRIIIAVAAFFTLLCNYTFFNRTLEVYPAADGNLGFLISLVLFLFAVIVILLSLVCFRRTIKPVSIALLLISATAAYFMDSYKIVIDDTMLLNIAHTDIAETLDLLSVKLAAYIVFLGVLPAVFIYRLQITDHSLRQQLIGRSKLLVTAIAIITLNVLLFGSHYASFFREHKPIRFYTNPVYSIYSAVKFAHSHFIHEDTTLTPIAEDAHTPPADSDRELIIMVVGETARADRFSLNGYQRNTNPLLEKLPVTSFTHVHSCGTSTATSVPCEFSILGRDTFDKSDASHKENVLDVLERSGVNVLWRDNNSDSKGVATRIDFQDYKSPETNPVCDIECRDIGMLSGLQTYIDEQQQNDIIIVLHQMGSHGPAYYKRYPKSFERFTPVCKTNQLEQCSSEQISNSYDNTILYTDYFLSRVIALLQDNAERFETSMLYVSDHGESLGEHGLYLHGLPYVFAPQEQTHVPLIVWFGASNDDYDIAKINQDRHKAFTHDNLFHTILGIMEIETDAYDRSMDILTHLEDDD